MSTFLRPKPRTLEQVVVSRDALRKLKGSELSYEPNIFVPLGKFEMPDNPRVRQITEKRSDRKTVQRQVRNRSR